MIKLDTPIKEWYEKTYPNDTASNLLEEQTFKDLLRYLLEEKAVRFSDSLIRERVFEALAEMLETEYNVIYDLWLNGF